MKREELNKLLGEDYSYVGNYNTIASLKNEYNERVKIIEEAEKEKEDISDKLEASAYLNFSAMINAICDIVSHYERKTFAINKTFMVYTMPCYDGFRPLFYSDVLLLIDSFDQPEDGFYFDYKLCDLVNNRKAIIIDATSKNGIKEDAEVGYTGIYDGNDKLIKFIDNSHEFIRHHDNIIEIKLSSFDSFEYVKDFIELVRGYKANHDNQYLSPQLIEALKASFIENYNKENNMNQNGKQR